MYLNATTQTLCWAVVFFFASAGASAGYLTASEVFPLEVRAKSIAVFFAIAQIFGAFGSHWYGHLIGDGTDRNSLFVGYLVGAGAMILGGIAAIIFGVNAEGKSAGGRRQAAVGHRQAAGGHLPRRQRPSTASTRPTATRRPCPDPRPGSGTTIPLGPRRTTGRRWPSAARSGRGAAGTGAGLELEPVLAALVLDVV